MITKQAIEKNLKKYDADFKTATTIQLYNAVSSAVMDDIAEKWADNRKNAQQSRVAAYLSAEFLIGRMVQNNLLNLGMLDETDRILGEVGRSVKEFEEIEDNALGNGGLGRLAACFLDSAAQIKKSLVGYGIRYKYGLFKQAIENGFQKELPDDWQKMGDPWSIKRDDLTYDIEFGDGVISAVAYDMPVIPYGHDNINTLRLFEGCSKDGFDFDLFNNFKYQSAVSKNEKAQRIHLSLYPNDNSRQGQILRLKQEYFFSSAAIQDMLCGFEKNIGTDYDKFADYFAVQLNDTHPVIAIPELIYRLGLRGVDFEKALEIAKCTFSYTNHTVMPEALEKWDIKFIRIVIPHLLPIIRQLQEVETAEFEKCAVDEKSRERMAIIANKQVNMANMAVFVSKKTNGVAAIHTEILKDIVLKEWYKLYPDRFVNKTNGITQRRWLKLCNPELCELIESKIGDGYITNLCELEKLAEFKDDTEFLQKFDMVKTHNKEKLATWLKDTHNIEVNVDSVFDIQAKRLHEYKRQLLNAFACTYIYFGIKDGSIKLQKPLTVLFAAKAAPGYMRAKAIIKYINEIAKLIDSDEQVRGKLKVAYIPNYNVSVAEKIMCAADLSEQISTAGTEASGTGNMKFMLNGTVTIGTLDGANIEIAEAAGIENEYIFGLRANEVENQKETYNPLKVIKAKKKVKKVLDTLIDGTVKDGGTGWFEELHTSLTKGASWHKPDNYFVLAELEDYVNKKLQAIDDYANDHQNFVKKCVMNTAFAGRFSSDRTIAEYCEEIWKI